MDNRGFFSWIHSNDKEIIDMLKLQSINLLKATRSLLDLISKFDCIYERISKIKYLEHTGDEITYKLFDIVNKAFAVPIDREDISKLADAIDDVLDDINETAQKFFLFRIQKPNAYMVELGKVMLRAIQEIYLLISQLQKLKDTKDLIGYCRNISEHEHQADIIYRNAIAELFESADPIEIIKVKEIYEMLERIVDKCEDVSNILESIIVKYR
jgi:uncharacterized protein